MTQQEYLIEKLAQENARLTVELHKANFAVIVLQEKVEKMETETENNENEKENEK